VGKLIKMEIPQKLIDYINTSRAPLPPVSDPEEPLQIDSLGLVRLVSFMESDCGIRVADEELVAENFATLRSLGELIEIKTQGADAAS
jgi:acyl carrier protein